jgi:hypothetical protein
VRFVWQAIAAKVFSKNTHNVPAAVATVRSAAVSGIVFGASGPADVRAKISSECRIASAPVQCEATIGFSTLDQAVVAERQGYVDTPCSVLGGPRMEA